MASKKRQSPSHKSIDKEGRTTLKDLLSAETLGKLKEQSEKMNQDALQLKEEKRKKEEEAHKAQQKRNENDFAYLLEHSKLDMRKD
jgi:hypothetical protein